MSLGSYMKIRVKTSLVWENSSTCEHVTMYEIGSAQNKHNCLDTEYVKNSFWRI